MARKDQRRLIQSLSNLFAERPWRNVDPDAPFTVHLPGEAAPWVCILIGQQGESAGLMGLRGPDALGCTLNMLRGEDPDPSALDLISLGWEPWHELTPFQREFLTEAGVRPRRETRVPGVYVARPGRRPRRPNATETRLLTRLADALRPLFESGRLRPSADWSGPGDWPAVHVDEADDGSLEARVEAGMRPEPREKDGPYLPLPRELAELEVGAATWLAGIVQLPVGIANDERTLSAFLVVNVDRPRVLTMEILPGLDLEPAVEALAKAALGQGDDDEVGLPGHLLFDSERLEQALGPGFLQLGVQIGRGSLPADLVESLTDALGPGMSTEEPPGPLPSEAYDPADEDGPMWLQADRDFRRRFVDPLAEDPRDRALSRYFYDAETGRGYLELFAQLGVPEAFGEWCFRFYRATKRSKTGLEKARAAKHLSSADLALLDARETAEFSLFRLVGEVDELDPHVECTLTGKRTRVWCSKPELLEVPGRSMPLQLLHVGQVTLANPAGPPLEPEMAEQFCERLRELDVEPTRETFTHAPGLLGGLSEILAQHFEQEGEALAAALPRFRNHDGDLTEEIVAIFSVRDFPGLRRALDQRADLERAPTGFRAWTRPVRPDRPGGARYQLGILYEENDTLIFEVNSDARLERMTAILQDVPGVSRAEVHRSPMGLARPLDEADWLDVLVLETHSLTTLARHWLDVCIARLDIPTERFDGQSPRDRAATPEGLAEVEAWIRSHAPFLSESGASEVEVDKQAWLEALGGPPSTD